MVPILINKDVSELSCNDLKFMVRNHDYFFTSLIVSLPIPPFSFQQFSFLSKLPSWWQLKAPLWSPQRPLRRHAHPPPLQEFVFRACPASLQQGLR